MVDHAEILQFNPAIAETERLNIRELQTGDEDDLVQIFTHPDVLQHVAFDPISSVEDAEQYIQQSIQFRQQRPRSSYEFAIVSKETGKVVGVNMLHVSERDRKAEIGMFLKKDEWGKGYATEAQLALMEFGFTKLGLHKLWATCEPDNNGSKKVIEKTGMQFITQIRDDKWIRRQNRYRDSLMYDILDSDWQVFKKKDTPARPIIRNIRLF